MRSLFEQGLCFTILNLSLSLSNLLDNDGMNESLIYDCHLIRSMIILFDSVKNLNQIREDYSLFY